MKIKTKAIMDKFQKYIVVNTFQEKYLSLSNQMGGVLVV